MIHAADLFAGAGGTSTGLAMACEEAGHTVDLVAINHWKAAVQTHKTNHPWARHIPERLEAEEAQPRVAVPGGKLDILAASPECTHHSRARGGKPMSDQSRATAMHILTWCEALRVENVLVENVPEFETWGPLGANGKPLKSRAGVLFKAWWNTLEAMGYKLEKRILNAADFGAATTRQRLFVLGTRRRSAIKWPDPTHSKEPDLLASERWRAAYEIIDWRIPGKSIYARSKPLREKTLRRIEAGIIRFRWPVRYIKRLHTYMRSLGLKPAEYDYEAAAHAEAMVVTLRNHADGRSIDRPVPTISAGGQHLGLAAPGSFVLSQGAGGAPRSTEDPIPSMTCDGAHALVAPYYGSGSGLTCTSGDSPLPSVTTKARFGLVVPVTHSSAPGRSRDINVEPMPTITTARGGELGLIVPAFGEARGQLPRVHSLDLPVPTICAEGRIQLACANEDDDILFRMFASRELALAMGFPEDYAFIGPKFKYERIPGSRKRLKVQVGWKKATQTEATRMIGNAVEVHQAKALFSAVIA